MSGIRPIRAIAVHAVVLLVSLAAATGVAFAQAGSGVMPMHASARGYRTSHQTCKSVNVPANGYLVDITFGRGWNCERGYRAIDEACVVVQVPKHGYFTDASYESGWKCDRGYRVLRNTCVAVRVPVNAHIDYSGNNWECDRPYRKQQNTCALL